MSHLRWNLADVAEYLGVSTDAVRALVDAGFIHYKDITDPASFDASAVKDWRRGLADGGKRGAEYVRELVRESTVQHA